ncbi:MAG TPA: ribonuclease Z [Nitrolancea sp.]|nr:ribonuclease Z [Nitrolancea sp.]
MIDLCLLGTGGMMPLRERWLSSMLLRSRRDVVLIDCGEGTQISWRYSGWGFHDVEAIFLTHHHADHVLGIAGVLFMIAHSNRTEPLTIFGPPGTYQVVQGLTIVVPKLSFPVSVVELDGGERHTLPDGLEINVLRVDHRVPCLAYTFTRNRAPKFDAERAQSLGIQRNLWSRLQSGETVSTEERLIPPDEVLGPPRRGLKVGFVTDTRVTPEIPEFVRDADLLVCEGTYGDPELRDRARQRGHMVFDEAATIAKTAGAKRLMLTHFSQSMLDPESFLHHATNVFAETSIGRPHETITLSFDED